MKAGMRNCGICDTPVDLTDVHPNSLPVPETSIDTDTWSVIHVSCGAVQGGDDSIDPDDNRAWITER